MFFFEGVLELIGIHKRIRALNFPYCVLMCIIQYVHVFEMCLCVTLQRGLSSFLTIYKGNGCLQSNGIFSGFEKNGSFDSHMKTQPDVAGFEMEFKPVVYDVHVKV